MSIDIQLVGSRMPCQSTEYRFIHMPPLYCLDFSPLSAESRNFLTSNRLAIVLGGALGGLGFALDEVLLVGA